MTTLRVGIALSIVFLCAVIPGQAQVGFSQTNPVPAGQSLLIPEGWRVSIVAFNPDAWPVIEANGVLKDLITLPPDEGTRYIMVKIRAENVSAGNPDSISSFLDLRIVGSSGIVGRSVIHSFAQPPDPLSAADEAFLGSTVEGNFVHEVLKSETDFVLITDFFLSGLGNDRFFAAGPGTIKPKVDDSRATLHVFPQFVDGSPGDGSKWTSTLMISALDEGSTFCFFSLFGLSTTLNLLDGSSMTDFIFNFGPNQFTVAKTPGVQPLTSGYGRLSCDKEVTAQVMFSLEIGGSLISEATVFSSPPGHTVQILSDQRGGSRTGIAVANSSYVDAQFLVFVGNIDGNIIGTTVLDLPGQSSQAKFLDQFVTDLPGD